MDAPRSGSGFGSNWFAEVGLPGLDAYGVLRAGAARDHAIDIPTFVDDLIERSIAARASDVHIEPSEEKVDIRIRLDGTLVHEQRLPLEYHPKIATHLKARASLDITERRRPLDGRLTWSDGEHTVDIRVSTVPGVFGEKIVLRLLDARRLPDSLGALGADARTEEALSEAASRARGLVLVTGPTGSGKSTTLYTLLRTINRGTRNVMTVEDPVEYHLDGATQVAVDTKVGRTFASILRSFLRQDPDVLLVGEIRDLETAEICIRASLTGHLVLSTLHTNNAAGAVERLVDMGVEPYLLASSLSLVCSQRLLRRLCQGCRTPSPEDLVTLQRFGLAVPDATLPSISHGCEQCRQTGVLGRVGIFETLLVSTRVKSLIREGAGAEAIHAQAAGEGLMSLEEQGMHWVRDGQVSTQEYVTQVLTANTLGDTP